MRPTLDATDAYCEQQKRSKRNTKKKFIEISAERLTCKVGKEHGKRCPIECSCDGTVVDCSNRGLKDMPKDVPIFATELRLNDNQIQKIRNTGLFKRSKHLVKLDLRNNQIHDIEDEAFNGLNALNDLLLTDNKLKQLRPEMLFGLKNLTTIRIEQNFIEELPNKMFSSLKRLNKIDLSKNNITLIGHDAFTGLKSLTSL